MARPWRLPRAERRTTKLPLAAGGTAHPASSSATELAELQCFHQRALAELSRRHALSAYDAAYLAAAERVGAPLASCDERDLISRGLATPPHQLLERRPRPVYIHLATAGKPADSSASSGS